MRKIGLIMFAGLLAAACNDSGNNTTATDSSARKDNTTVYDTGVGSSMTDTSQKMDTAHLTKKIDTGTKK